MSRVQQTTDLCGAPRNNIWHAPASCEHPAGHDGDHGAHVTVSEDWNNPGQLRWIAWDAKGHGKANDIISTPTRNRGGDPRVVKPPTKETKMTTATVHVSSGRTAPLSSFVLEAPIKGGGTWTNPREFTGLEPSEIEKLGERIKVNGITIPLLVQQVRIDGKIYNLTIDGQRRYLGAKDALPKSAELPVVDVTEEVIEELTPEIADALTLKALTSIDREDLTSYELSSVAERMKARGKSGEYIGKAIGKSESWVSRMLNARKTATPKLLIQWRKGEITDEQFKDLATASADQQNEAAKEVVEARKSGDKTEARVRAKEIRERSEATKTGKAPRIVETQPVKPVLTEANGGKQAEMFGDKTEKPAKPAGPKPPSRVVLEQFLAMADKRPPTADVVKGLFLGVRYAMGLVDVDSFGKAWDQYVARLEGKPKAPKKAKKGKLQAIADRQAKRAKKLDAAVKKGAKKAAKKKGK
jgi:ParB/RepB/Spo0J family partition protein